jgi:hypothetical protein
VQWNVIGAYILDQVYGYQSANKFRENLIVLASQRRGRFLGGSRLFPNAMVIDPDTGDLYSKEAGLGPNDVLNHLDVELDGTNQAGMTFQARVEVRTSGSGFAITPKIRNVTDSVDAGTGSSCTATAQDYSGTNQKQTIALTIASGVKKYRLQYTLGALGGSTWLTGEIEGLATA